MKIMDINANLNKNLNSKQSQTDDLDIKFKTLCEKVLQQLSFAGEIIQKKQPEDFYDKVAQTEIEIDLLENEIRTDVVTMFLYAPKAAKLRKLITYQDITNYLEAIADLLIDSIFYPMKKFDTNLPEFDYFQVTLSKMLSYAKEMLNNAIFSFCYEDSQVAHKTIADDDVLDKLFCELSENTILSFQELSLSEQELINIISISNMAYIIEQIGDMATQIAEAAVFMIEGTDIRHRK
jgi:phosphate transport system protein